MSKIIRASDNTRFTLLEDRMTERTFFKPYYLFRDKLRTALEKKHDTVRYYLTDGFCPGHPGWIEHGVTQRNKKFISIGCMRFVGENRTKLIRWAKSGK